MGKSGVTGLIVPLEGQAIHLVFHHRPIVPLFVSEFPSDLEEGDRAFLYVTGGEKILDGEGAISSVTYERVGDVRRYGEELCLSAQELDQYLATTGKTEDDMMLVLKLSEPTKYVKPMRCNLPIPKDGVYMTAETFFTILRDNR